MGGSGGNAEGGGTLAGGAYPRGAALLLVEPKDFWEGASLGGKGMRGYWYTDIGQMVCMRGYWYMEIG